MNKNLVIILLVLSFIGCDIPASYRLTDSEIKRKLPGHYTIETTEYFYRLHFETSGKMSMSMDGKGLYAIATSANKLLGSNDYTGTWTVRELTLSFKIIGNKSAGADLFQKIMGAVGKPATGYNVSDFPEVTSCTIVSIDESGILLQNGNKIPKTGF